MLIAKRLSRTVIDLFNYIQNRQLLSKTNENAKIILIHTLGAYMCHRISGKQDRATFLRLLYIQTKQFGNLSQVPILPAWTVLAGL